MRRLFLLSAQHEQIVHVNFCNESIFTLVGFHAIGIIENTPTERWKHHGFGLLQVSLTPAHRINLWAPELRTVPRELGGWHTHRALVHATVLAGSVFNTTINWLMEGSRFWRWALAAGARPVDVWSVPHRPVALGMRHVGSALADVHEQQEVTAGFSYSIPHGTAHCTEAGPLGAVTSAMAMDMTDDEAVVLVPSGRQPLPAFEQRCSDALIDEIRARSVEMLLAVLAGGRA